MNKHKNNKPESYSFKDMQKKWAREKRWQQQHPIQTAFIDVFDFFRYRIPRMLNDTKYSIIYAKDRAFRGYDDRMIFSYYSENADLAIKVLSHLRKHRTGSPMLTKSTKNCHAEWNVALDKMIAGFVAVKKISEVHIRTHGKYDHIKTLAEIKRLTKVWKAGMKLYVDSYSGLWD